MPDDSQQAVQEGTFNAYPGKYPSGDLSGLESAISSVGGNPDTTDRLTFEGQTMRSHDKDGNGTVTYTYSVDKDGKTHITAVEEQAPIADK